MRVAGFADIAGDEQDAHRGVTALHFGGELGAGHFGHHHVGDDQLDVALALEDVERFPAAGDRIGAVAELLQRADGRAADPGIVLDDQDGGAVAAFGGLGVADRRRRAHRGLLRRRGRAGQVDGDGGALAQFRRDGDIAAGLAREAEDLRKAEPGALADRLGGEEGLEHAVEMLGRDAAAGVGDADADIIAGGQIGVLGFLQGHVVDLEMEIAASLHRVAGVDGEVQHRIFELGGIGPDVPQIAGEAGVDGDPLADRAVDQLEHVLDQLGRRHRVGQQRLGAGEGEQAAGEGGGAGRALHRIVEVEFDLAARAVQLAAGEIEAADDDREHVVEIVRDAAGELADRLHLLDLAELGFGGGAGRGLPLQRRIGVGKLAGARLHGLFEVECAPAPAPRPRAAPPCSR